MSGDVERAVLVRAISTGFAACQAGDVYNARLIFEDLIAAKPDLLPAKIGEAFTYLVVDDFAKGDAKLAVLPDDDEDVVAMRIMSRCLQRDVEGAEQLFSQIEGSESPSRAMAAEFIKAAKLRG
ncbi:MAG: hypothetical protein K6A65_03615 [Succinivibrionaceae bacterium]|nr:hypothetical protein [Succinivibrionaceae bacterium]